MKRKGADEAEQAKERQRGGPPSFFGGTFFSLVGKEGGPPVPGVEIAVASPPSTRSEQTSSELRSRVVCSRSLARSLADEHARFAPAAALLPVPLSLGFVCFERD